MFNGDRLTTKNFQVFKSFKTHVAIRNTTTISHYVFEFKFSLKYSNFSRTSWLQTTIVSRQAIINNERATPHHKFKITVNKLQQLKLRAVLDSEASGEFHKIWKWKQQN